MKVLSHIGKMQEFSRQVRHAGLRVGFVPTMGFLHEGHMELVRRARREAEVVVVSIFVNPKQFDRKEDFDRYPRDDERDHALLAAERVDVLFRPDAEEVYKGSAATTVSVAGLTATLCGPGRPGHFDGVATVVASLFNMVLPDFAVFGEKDYQQLQVIRRMTEDLHFPVRIVAAPTVREADGLAMSSRNARLGPGARAKAPTIYRALSAAAEAFARGESTGATLVDAARAVLTTESALEVEYLDLVDGRSLKPVTRADERSVVAIAAWLEGVRLIDNVVLGRWLTEHDTAGPSTANGAGRIARGQAGASSDA
jgi:pantoate--beta-alanine ligase